MLVSSPSQATTEPFWEGTRSFLLCSSSFCWCLMKSAVPTRLTQGSGNASLLPEVCDGSDTKAVARFSLRAGGPYSIITKFTL